MPDNLLHDGERAGDGPEISESLLSEAFRASEDPEVTLFLASLDRFLPAGEGVDRGLWREHVGPPEAEDELGRIDGHVLRALIAEGGMAVVFRAEERALERTVALKMLAPGFAENAGARSRFLREAKAAAGLDHENILPIYRVGEEPLPHFTMRHVGGGSLQDRLDRGESLSTGEWFSLARQVAGALGAAHAAGIVHRDIKPANLLYEEAGGRLWVTDFGIAASVDDPLTGGGSVLGTPRYMSPEQARGGATDGRSDLFALGAVLYRCVAGEDLVAGENSAAVFESLLSADFAMLALRNESIAPPQRNLLAGLLGFDPQDRFADAASFLEALGREEEASMKKVSISPRSRGSFIAVLVVATVALLAVIPFVFRSLRSAPVAAAVAPAPSLPEIRIEGWGGVYRDFTSAFAASPDGSTLLLDGVFVCRETHFGPEGRRLSLRSAPGAHAVVIASEPDQHALFLRGATELNDITFVRESGSGNVVPIVGIYGGDAVVRNCRFETVAPEERLLGGSLSFTHLEKALIDKCVFKTSGRDALAFGFVEGSPPMRVTVRDSIVFAGVAATRRVWGESGPLELDWDRSVIVADAFYLEHPKNRVTSFSPLSFRLRDCGLDLGEVALLFGNGASPFAANPPVGWAGERNRHAASFLRLDWTAPGDTLSDTTSLEIPLTGELVDPLTGSENAPRIGPFLDRGATAPSFDAVVREIRRDPAFADLVKEVVP